MSAIYKNRNLFFTIRLVERHNSYEKDLIIGKEPAIPADTGLEKLNAAEKFSGIFGYFPYSLDSVYI